jgi:rhamnose utilization protein RhaD (predicted bifunctional aldolase and dehydrogenase)
VGDAQITELIGRSNRLGADPRNTNYAGGNTSAKGTGTDPVTGQDVELMWVKGSGGDLGTLTPGSTGRTRWWRRSTSACTAWVGWWGPG